MEMRVPGVFAVGDVRHGSVKRVASAVGAGAIAIQSVHEYFIKAKLGLDVLRGAKQGVADRDAGSRRVRRGVRTNG